MPTTLTYDTLKAAVAGGATALRLTLRLEAVSPKVFPPTYEGGKYATETRRIGGQELPCVLLDSVPSQANRMELALQEAVDAGEIALPVVSSDFSTSEFAKAEPAYNLSQIKVTSLQAPHRIADAILRDSTTNVGGKSVKFKDTEVGLALDNEVSFANATPLLKFAPHCLVYGMWHSTGEKRRAAGVKFSRAVTSEIVGVNAVPGVTTSSRLDPLGIQKLVDKEDEAGVKIYKAKDGGWTLTKERAAGKPGKEEVYGKKGKPSEINHGNVTPDIAYRRDKNNNPILGDTERPVMMVVFDNDANERGQKYVIRDERRPIAKGGFTVDYSEQTTVVSLPALRRFHFPTPDGGRSVDTDVAARTYLAALGLLGATLAVEAGYHLRSRCELHAAELVAWELFGRPGEEKAKFGLTRQEAVSLYEQALSAVRAAGLPVHTEEVVLTPSDDLVSLVKKSHELTASDTEDAS